MYFTHCTKSALLIVTNASKSNIGALEKKVFIVKRVINVNRYLWIVSSNINIVVYTFVLFFISYYSFVLKINLTTNYC